MDNAVRLLCNTENFFNFQCRGHLLTPVSFGLHLFEAVE